MVTQVMLRSIVREYSNLVDHSFEYLSFSNKRKTPFLSLLTFLQWAMGQCLFVQRSFKEIKGVLAS